MDDDFEKTEMEVEELHKIITKCRARHEEQSDLLEQLNKDESLKSTAIKKPKLITDSNDNDKPTLKARFEDLARTYQEWEMEISTATNMKKVESSEQDKSIDISSHYKSPATSAISFCRPISARKATPFKVHKQQVSFKNDVKDDKDVDVTDNYKEIVKPIDDKENESITTKIHPASSDLKRKVYLDFQQDAINETPITRRRVREVVKIFEKNPDAVDKRSFTKLYKDNKPENTVGSYNVDAMDNTVDQEPIARYPSQNLGEESNLSVLSPCKLPENISSPPISSTSDLDLCAEMNIASTKHDDDRSSQIKVNKPSDNSICSSDQYAEEVSYIFGEALGYEESDDDLIVPDIVQTSYNTPTNRKETSQIYNERRSISHPCSPNAKSMANSNELPRCKSTDCIKGETNVTAEYSEKIKEMESGLLRIELSIDQASAALRLCRGGNFALSDQIESSRILLSACHRKQAILEEIARLKRITPEHLDFPLASVSLNTIVLPLDPDYMNALAAGIDKRVFFVTCYVHYRTDVIQTTLCSTPEILLTSSASSPCMIFSNHMNFNKLSPDFQIKIYIYCLEKRLKGNVKNFRELRSRAKGSFRKLLKTAKDTYGAGNRETAGRFVNFVQVDAVQIQREHINQSKFPLKLSSSKFPFVGHIMLCSEFRLSEHVNHSGFLTHHSIVGGLGVWQRYWCVLENVKLRLWKNPEDCDHKSLNTPNRVLPLSMCKPRSVRILPFDECARPHTIEILMSTCEPSDVNKHWFAADTAVDSKTWINKLTLAIDTAFYWSALC